MSKFLATISLSFLLANFAWAGFGQVKVTENTAGSVPLDRVFSKQLTPPFITIGPSGDGQIVFARDLNTAVGTLPYASEIYAQPVDQFNQLQTPTLLVDKNVHNTLLYPLSLLTDHTL